MLPISFISNEYITRIMGQARPVCPACFALFSSSSTAPPLAYIETKRISDESRIGGTTFIEIGPGRLNNSPYRRRVAGRCCRDFGKSRKACTSIRSEYFHYPDNIFVLLYIRIYFIIPTYPYFNVRKYY